MSFTWSTDVSPGEWMASRLLPLKFPVQVGAIVPTGFPSYCRILHPAYREHGQRVRWRELAAWAGTELTSHAGYEYIALPEHPLSAPSPASGGDPLVGSMDVEDFATLVGIVSGHRPDPETWWGVWDGHGWDGRVSVVMATGERRLVPDPVPTAVRQAPRLKLPYRNYLIAHGTPEDARTFALQLDQTPNLWWAADQSWCVATEIDFACTYIGGPAALIGEIVASNELEAVPVDVEDVIGAAPPAWLERALDLAVQELVDNGHATISTGQGVVRASLVWHYQGQGTLTLSQDFPWLPDSTPRMAPVRTEDPGTLTKELRADLLYAVCGFAGRAT